MVTTTLFAIMAVTREEARKIGLVSNELMPEMCRFRLLFVFIRNGNPLFVPFSSKAPSERS